MIVGLMAAFGSTLTMPGLAGLVLTLGIAVDANVIIYERKRRTKIRKKDVLKAAQEGL